MISKIYFKVPLCPLLHLMIKSKLLRDRWVFSNEAWHETLRPVLMAALSAACHTAWRTQFDSRDDEFTTNQPPTANPNDPDSYDKLNVDPNPLKYQPWFFVTMLTSELMQMLDPMVANFFENLPNNLEDYEYYQFVKDLNDSLVNGMSRDCMQNFERHLIKVFRIIGKHSITKTLL